jgi:hypothetical protein
MFDDTAPTPTTFPEAIEWIGKRSGLYAMKMDGSRVVISVRIGSQRASVAAASANEVDLQAALIRAIVDLRSQ